MPRIFAAAALFFCAAAFAAGTDFSPAASGAPRAVTIRGVYLKNDAGAWVKIIEPDRRVDLSVEEPVVSFFNNGGRIPAGAYKNFRVDFYGEGPELRHLRSKDDFEKSVAVKKGSFVRVWFGLAPEGALKVEKAGLTVDADTRELAAETLSPEA